MRLICQEVRKLFSIAVLYVSILKGAQALIRLKTYACTRGWARVGEVRKTAFKGQANGFGIVQIVQGKTVWRQKDAVPASYTGCGVFSVGVVPKA